MSTLPELKPKLLPPLGSVSCQTSSTDPDPSLPNWQRFHVFCGTPFDPPKVTLVATTCVAKLVHGTMLITWCWIIISLAQLFIQMSKPISETVVDDVSGVSENDEYM